MAWPSHSAELLLFFTRSQAEPLARDGLGAVDFQTISYVLFPNVVKEKPGSSKAAGSWWGFLADPYYGMEPWEG